MLLDGKLVNFKDFEILESIGEGSFGRVFKCKKKSNGQLLALKVMKKYAINRRIDCFNYLMVI